MANLCTIDLVESKRFLNAFLECSNEEEQKNLEEKKKVFFSVGGDHSMNSSFGHALHSI
jgi:hypothetical protein